MSAIQITLDTSFKHFVEAKGVRFIEVERGTGLYRKLIDEFNRLKQTFLDKEEMEKRQEMRALSIEEEDREELDSRDS